MTTSGSGTGTPVAGGVSTTLASIVSAISYELTDMESGTATAGETTTLTDTSTLVQSEDNYWKWAWLYIATTTDGAAPQAQERQITAFTAASWKLTVSKAFTVAVGVGDTYEIRKRESRAAIVRAINQALHTGWPHFFDLVVDETTLDTASNTFKYSLPTECKALCRVYLERDSDQAWEQLRYWKVITSGASRYLLLPQANTYDTGKGLRLVYERELLELSASTDTTSAPLEWVKAEAMHLLMRRRALGAPGRGELELALANEYKRLAEDARKRGYFRHEGTVMRLSWHLPVMEDAQEQVEIITNS